jgi:iron(III) transport system ATP-binding protein
MLRIVDVHKQYPKTDQVALHPISLTIAQGEIVALAGESGSGKSTLLSLMAGLNEPDGGNIWIGKERLLPPSEVLVPGHKDIEMLTQKPNLFPNMRLYENIGYYLRLLPSEIRKKRLQEAFDVCGLVGMEQRFPNELSGGQQQRAALAKALVKQPKVLLLDEPFSQLDSPTKESLKTDLLRIARKFKQTLVMALHDATDAFLTAHRLIVLKQGQLIADAPPRQLYLQPTDAYLAKLLGHVNVITATHIKKVLLRPFVSMPSEKKTLLVRPEQLAVCPPAEAHFAGTISGIRFMGAYDLCEVSLSKQIDLQVLVNQSFTQDVGQIIYLSVKNGHWV